MKDLKERLKEIRYSIELLRQEEMAIEGKLYEEAKSFKEKLEIWRDSSYKEHEDVIIDESEYPNLYKYFEFHFNKYETYNLTNWFSRDIEKILKDEDVKEDVLLCLQEAVETNLGSFTCDW